ncbi:ATP-dependent DNA helicase [Trichonephila inaurata madagascariensis]|uniref:ATP-dependent DNA helicase n=1 Tax=Trichonephila inaurata madagascariensis TaxID=2747483 RepID=A0A8X6MCW5_9ARAC|nr:ATP-dependent DNA helicase [Trichonephila inaurata madagascariensis]
MQKLTGKYLKVMCEQWKDTEFLFIDEISMVPYQMLCMIENRLQQLKTDNVLFAGINLLIFGDLMQLPPIRGSQVINQPQYMAPAIHLWQLLTLVELRDNMRQQGDNTFCYLKFAELEIFVRAKVMLRTNIDVKKGLVNGAIGFITEIHWSNFRRTQMYEQDIPSVTVNFGNNGVHRIEPTSVQFPAKRSYGTAE